MMARKTSALRCIAVLLWAASILLLISAAGCGEKIGIPQATGFWGNLSWSEDAVFPQVGTVQLATSGRNLFILTPDSLIKKDEAFETVAAIGGLADATAFCLDRTGARVYVWEQGAKRVAMYESQELVIEASVVAETIDRIVSMTTSPAGISSVDEGRTFLYLSDPDLLLVHRYAVKESFEIEPHGILTSAGFAATRSVHIPAGLARDNGDTLLVCDVAEDRNWVIRFGPEPDYENVTADPDDQDPWMGNAALFHPSVCLETSPFDYTLGRAPTCDEPDIDGRPSDEPGEFDGQSAVAVDGEGKIYVADTGNRRIQVFTRDGYYQTHFQIGEDGAVDGPVSLGAVDIPYGLGLEDYGAYIYVFVTDEDVIRRYISSDYYFRDTKEPPPEP